MLDDWHPSRAEYTAHTCAYEVVASYAGHATDSLFGPWFGSDECAKFVHVVTRDLLMT